MPSLSALRWWKNLLLRLASRSLCTRIAPSACTQRSSHLNLADSGGGVRQQLRQNLLPDACLRWIHAGTPPACVGFFDLDATPRKASCALKALLTLATCSAA